MEGQNNLDVNLQTLMSRETGPLDVSQPVTHLLDCYLLLETTQILNLLLLKLERLFIIPLKLPGCMSH